jgi:glycosyltransferase involved in cell wall biosynthesis
MNIFIIIKCGLQDAFNFISQVVKVEIVEKVIVFRDEESIQAPKVEYKSSRLKRIRILNQICRFFQVIKARKYFPAMIIGIYEIPHGFIAVLAGKILDCPSIVSVIGNPAYTKIRRGLRMRITKWILQHATYVTVTGTKSKEFLVSKGISEKKIRILPNTLDFSKFKVFENESKKFDIISLGRISAEKHVELIVEIVAKLKEYMPNVKAAIAGKGSELAEIRNLISKLKLEKNIELPGYVPDDKLVEFYNSGRIFVLTSETEGFPRTIIQAAACGLPVIASDVGDISDIIDHCYNGFLVKNFWDVEEYSKRIIQLMTDENMYNSFSKKLYEKVHNEFAVERASDVWCEILISTSSTYKKNNNYV